MKDKIKLKQFGGNVPVIALEGIDGSGKGVQFKLLRSELEESGYKVGVLDFPCYDSFFGKEIGKLLSGEDGVDALKLDPKSMSLWYAMDRKAAFDRFNASEYDVVLLNRSTMANAAYQGSRVQFEALRRGEDPGKALKEYIDWLFTLEFSELGIPRPDIFIVFDIPVSTSRRNVAKKGRREYIGGDRADVYEKDTLLLETVRKGYITCAEMFDDVQVLVCADGSGEMLPVEEINARVISLISESGD